MLGLGLIGSIGFAAVVTGKNRELARQTQRAEKREQTAIDAVERFRDVVVEEPVLKNNPALEELRKKLLKEPLAFFQSLREQLQADKDTRPEALRDWPRRCTPTQSSPTKSETSRTAFGRPSRAWQSGKNSCAIIRRRPIISKVWRRLSSVEARCSSPPAMRTTRWSRSVRRWRSSSGWRERTPASPHSRTTWPQATTTSGSSGAGRAIRTRRWSRTARHWQSGSGSRENPSVTVFQSNLADSHNSIGLLQSNTGHPDQALESYGKALAIQERLRARTPASQRSRAAWPTATSTLGSSRAKRAIRTRPWSRTARRWRSESGCAREPQRHRVPARPGPKPQQPRAPPAQHGRSGPGAGVVRQGAGDPGTAGAENPSVTEFQSDLAGSHYNIGKLQHDTGNPDQALESYGKALAIQERLARDNPSVTKFQSSLASSHNNIGSVQGDTGHPDQALESYRKALAIRERLACEHPEAPDYASNVGSTLNNMATIDLDAKRFEQARDKLRQAISWQKKALATNPRNPTYRQFLRNHLYNVACAAALAASAKNTPTLPSAQYCSARKVHRDILRKDSIESWTTTCWNAAVANEE